MMALPPVAMVCDVAPHNLVTLFSSINAASSITNNDIASERPVSDVLVVAFTDDPFFNFKLNLKTAKIFISLISKLSSL